MKPVTEDQVQTLLNGLERREKEALQALAKKSASQTRSAGRMTARIFGLRATTKAKELDRVSDVVDIAHRRKDRRSRATSKGFFLYSAVARNASQSS